MLKRIVTCACAALLAVLPCVSSVSASAAGEPWQELDEYLVATIPETDNEYFIKFYYVDGSYINITVYFFATSAVTYSTDNRIQLPSGTCYFTTVTMPNASGGTPYGGTSFYSTNALSWLRNYESPYFYMTQSNSYNAYYYLVEGSGTPLVDHFVTNIPMNFSYGDYGDTNVTILQDKGSVFEPTYNIYDATLKQYASEDPTELTTEGSGFQLPQEWIDGGETLQDPTVETFESINFDDALQQFETQDFTVPSNVANGIGAFWYIFDLYLGSTDLLWLVSFLMLVTLITWALGRKV